MIRNVAMFFAVINVVWLPLTTLKNNPQYQENNEKIPVKETTIRVTPDIRAGDFTTSPQRNADINGETIAETRDKDSDFKPTETYASTPEAESADSIEKTFESSNPSPAASEHIEASDAMINEDMGQQEVEAELITFLNPAIDIMSASFLDDFIYVLGVQNLGENSEYFLLLVYENKRPFDLLMIILLEEIRWARSIESNQESNCLYIREIGNSRVGRPSRIWKINLEDHRVMKWMSNVSSPAAISATSDGGLLITTFSETSTNLRIFDENAELLQSLTLFQNNKLFDFFAHAVQEPNGNIIIYDLSETYCFRVRRLSLSSGSITEQVQVSENMTVLVHFKPPLRVSSITSDENHDPNGSCYVELRFRAENKSVAESSYLFPTNTATFCSLAPGAEFIVLAVPKIAPSTTRFRLRFTSLTRDIRTLFDEEQIYPFCFPAFGFSNLILYLNNESKFLLVPNSQGRPSITVLDSESLNRSMVIDFGIPNLHMRGYDRRNGRLLLSKFDNLMIFELESDVFKHLKI